jgi:predicted PurR-regulated permease PerM
MASPQQRVLLGLLLAVLVVILLGIAWPFASALVLRLILAIVMHPVYLLVCRTLSRPGLASFLTTLATVVFLGTTAAFITVTAVKSSKNAYNALNQRSSENVAGPGVIVQTTDQMVDALAARLPVPRETIRARVLAGMEAGAGYVFTKTQRLRGVTCAVSAANLYAASRY